MESRKSDTDQLMTVAEVAELLQVKDNWVYSHAKMGELPHVYVGRYLRFRRDDIMEWLAVGVA